MLNKYIMELLEHGVEVGLLYRDGKVLFDLNTKMKSHCWVEFLFDDTVEFHTRYKSPYKRELYGMVDLLLEVRACMCGRDFYNRQYDGLFDKYDLGSPVDTRYSL